MNRVMMVGMLVTTALVAGAFWAVGPAAISNPVNVIVNAVDKDRDNVADDIERELCSRKLTRDVVFASDFGRCASSTNWIPPVVEQRRVLPILVTPGPDDDGDGLPAYLELKTLEIAVNVFNETVVYTQPVPGPSHIIDLDRAPTGDDKDPDFPVLSLVKVPSYVPSGISMGDDLDGDGLPATLTLHRYGLEFDRRKASDRLKVVPADPLEYGIDHESLGFSDKDPQKPVHRFIAVHIPTHIILGPDGDGDLLPAYVQVNHFDVTIDRNPSSDVSRITMGDHDGEPQTVDADDTSRDKPVEWNAIDKDGDFVVDDLETLICSLQSDATPDDGACLKADGTGDDGSGMNYVAPADRPNPWNRQFYIGYLM